MNCITHGWVADGFEPVIRLMIELAQFCKHWNLIVLQSQQLAAAVYALGKRKLCVAEIGTLGGGVSGKITFTSAVSLTFNLWSASTRAKKGTDEKSMRSQRE
jgi:hypothetical protein